MRKFTLEWYEDKHKSGFTNISNTIRMIELQADLKPLNFGLAGHPGQIIIRYQKTVRLHKEIVKNRSRLEAWAGKVEPKGPVMDMCRVMYSQLTLKLRDNQELIDVYAEHLERQSTKRADGEEEKGPPAISEDELPF